MESKSSAAAVLMELPRKGQRHVAWGASPRKGMPHESQSPEGATADPHSEEDCRRPLGALGLWRNRPPGAGAPGYMPPPLRGCSFHEHPLCCIQRLLRLFNPWDLMDCRVQVEPVSAIEVSQNGIVLEHQVGGLPVAVALDRQVRV